MVDLEQLAHVSSRNALSAISPVLGLVEGSPLIPLQVSSIPLFAMRLREAFSPFLSPQDRPAGRTYSQHCPSSPAGPGSGGPLTSNVGVRMMLRLSHGEVMISPRLYPSEAILWTLSALFFLSYFLNCFTNCQKKRCMKV